MLNTGDLVARCQAGDDVAWEALVRRLQGRIFATAFHYLRDREEARDTAQDIFVRVYQKLHTLDPSRPFLPWLLRLARNCCIDRLRRLEVRTPEASVPIDSAPEIPDPKATPEDSFLQTSRDRMLHRALGDLSAVNREVILLKEIQGFKLEEIAELLEVPLGTVKSRSNRARLELSKVLYAMQERGETIAETA